MGFLELVGAYVVGFITGLVVAAFLEMYLRRAGGWLDRGDPPAPPQL